MAKSKWTDVLEKYLGNRIKKKNTMAGREKSHNHAQYCTWKKKLCEKLIIKCDGLLWPVLTLER